MDDAPAWTLAFAELERLQRSVTTLALLRGALRTGLLATLAGGSVPGGELAAGLGSTEPRVAAALELLRAHGIVEPDDSGAWSLSDGWAELVRGETPVHLEGTLSLGQVWATQFEDALEGGDDYWQLEPSDRLAVATGISPDPRSAVTIAMARGIVEPLPGVADRLAAGGLVLELGCGLASRLCALLQAFPQARAVGVELDAHLVAAAGARAVELGLDDRLELVVGDAAQYDGHAEFALVNWSQFFFPEPSRPGALAAALRSLAPGGWISMPVIWDGQPPAAGTDADQELAEMRLVLDLWGVPMRSTAEVVAEVADAGFVEVHDAPAPGFTVVRGRRP